MRIKKCNENFIAAIQVFLIVFLTSSYVITNGIYSGALESVLWIIVFGSALWSGAFANKIKIKAIIFLVVYFVSTFLTTIFFKGELGIWIKVSFMFLTVFLICNSHSKECIIKGYLNVMYYLAVLSLFFYSSYLIIPSFYKSLPVVGRGYVNFIIFVQDMRPHNYFPRNSGMFWEPGAFVTFLVIALLIEITKKNSNNRRLFLLIAAIVTTFSTTGYMALAGCMFMLLSQKKAGINRRLYVGILMSMIAMVLLLNQEIFFSTKGSTVLGKLISLKNQDYREYSSIGVRVNSVVKPLQYFVKSPLIGYGRKNLTELLIKDTFGMLTCTPVNWFAMYGLFIGSYMTYFLYRFSKKMTKGIRERILFFSIFFIVLCSENYVDNATILMIVFPYHVKDIKKVGAYIT